MKNKKEKKKILKIRPFNMANFSGGSGYLVFSLIYQAMALLPAMIIIWFVSLIKPPKNEAGEIDAENAGKRFYIVSVPISVILVILATVFAFITNYGTFFEYWFEVIFIALVPTISTFFILKGCHKEVINGKSILKMILVSVVGVLFVLVVTFIICAFMIDPILTSFID